MKTPESVLRLLDSTELTRKEKQALLKSYWLTHPTSDDLLLAAIGPSLGVDRSFNADLVGSIASRAVAAAHAKEFDDLHKRLTDELDKRVNGPGRDAARGRQKLDEFNRAGSATHVGAAKSDEILDAGLPGLDAFRRFAPVYVAAPSEFRRNPALLGGQEDIFNAVKRLYDEQRGIDFAKLDAQARQLTDAKIAVESASGRSSAGLSGLYTHWTGKAAERSRVFSDRFRVQVQALTDSLQGSADLIRGCSARVAKLCRGKAEMALSLHEDKMCDRTVGEGLLIMQLANGRREVDVRVVARMVNPTTARMVDSDACELNEETYEFAEQQAKLWAEGFCRAFEGKFSRFEEACGKHRGWTDEVWKELTTFLNGRSDNPFKELLGGTPPGGGPKPPPGGGGGGPIGGGGGGGGGGRVPPIAAPPPITPPVVPPIQTPPLGGTETSGLPGTQLPGMPVPGGNQPRESVSFEDAGRKISVTSPTRDGHVTITVEGPDGKPKSYEVDFGPSGPEVKPMPQPGGIPVQPGNVVPQENPVTKADENGKAAIRAGDRTILAERVPGDAGHIRVSVPGADGEPTTYDIDFTQGQVELASGSGVVEEVAEHQQAPQPGEAGLGSIPSEGQRAPNAPPMGTGMMMPPAAQGSGGDQERGGNNWRTEGYVFEEDNEAISRVARVLGGLDDEEN
ncbi:hypothetical protein NLX83_06195 [Allokutzneria sp. A3M-2-11 16]|uniref:WXG100 family type VII secretion target n=1 Tax=Allokutzneria sp. A3M-2-11 16 TaxID=2962043 RepID=UPI0020B7428B|nr:hypothetical protein [Allokutzneria sp. A3M-2-11 16]MCP3798843.1 hypothetical protein [Allokutzneria sp. A3M-2-11 16]